VPGYDIAGRSAVAQATTRRNLDACRERDSACGRQQIDEYGQNPKGVLIFDNGDHYAVIIMRSDLPKIAANRADQGTPQENQAIVAGLVTHFGTYAVDEANKTLISHIEASSFPNNDGNDQRRIIVLLTADELKYGPPTTVTGTKAEVTWKRMK
jgi:hypothetical protein